MTRATDEIRYTRRKTLAISVLPGGKVVVRAPLRTSPARIAAFLREHADWIDNARAKMSAVPPPAEAYSFAEGEGIWYLGARHPLTFGPKVPEGLALRAGKGFVLQESLRSRAEGLLVAFYRAETRRMVTELVQHFSARHGLRSTGIRITSAKTRWGSCSSKNTLNFSYRLAMTPPACVAYVAAHELAHTRAHNHSSAFWALVGEIDPEYKKARAWLKKNGASLPLI